MSDESLSLSDQSKIAEAKEWQRRHSVASAQVEKLLTENATLTTRATQLTSLLRSLMTDPETNANVKLRIRYVLDGILPTRQEIIDSLKTPADDCSWHHGALGERCAHCGEPIDSSTKEERARQREEIADHVLANRGKETPP